MKNIVHLGITLCIACASLCSQGQTNTNATAPKARGEPEPPAPPCACADGTATILVGARETRSGAEMNACTREVFRIHSPSMTRDIEVGVLLPPAYAGASTNRFPVLYALHGMGAPFLCWTEMAPLRQALAGKPMIVVVFNGDRAGCYIDATKRPRSRFTTFFFDELVPFVDQAYRVDPARRGVTGFSMGGSGASHYMLARPAFFAGVSSLSSGFDLTVPWSGDRPLRALEPLLGPQAENPSEYVKAGFYSRCEAAIARGVGLPPLFVACGTEDAVLQGARRARDFLARQQVPFEYLESPGAHNWSYWRDTSAAVIDFHWRTFQAKYEPKNLSRVPPEVK